MIDPVERGIAMKKLLYAMLALVLLCSLSACGDFVSLMPGTELEASTQSETEGSEDFFEPKTLYDFLGWQDFGSNYYNDTPVALTYTGGGDDEGGPSPVFDRATIVSACDILRNITVTGAADTDAAGDDDVYTFTMADGETYTVSFAGGLLETARGKYAVTGFEALDGLAFPGYSDSFGIFDLYYNDSIADFARNFQEDTAVSVGRRENSGAILTSEDPEVVWAVFNALRGASVNRAEKSPDQNIDLTQSTDYIFTMSDGKTYTFTFTQQCLTVTALQSYGPVYYWLDNIDGLWNVSVMPDDDTADFTGGSITGLRTDLQELQDVLDGARTDLSVLGVYVDYVISGESGYFTLEGDEAVSFLRTALSVTAGGELVEKPEGETITISVTLSDGSGPIFYFTGDAIQQVMGRWFQCDTSTMSTLRSAISELAAAYATNTTDVRNNTSSSEN